MFDPVVPPPPQLHIKTHVTDKQERLNGSNTYHPRVPANAPAGQFWAVDVYDAETGAFIRESPVAWVRWFVFRCSPKNSDGQVRPKKCQSCGAIFDARTFEPEAVYVDAARQEWTALTPQVAPELALIKGRLPGHAFHMQNQAQDGRRWIVVSYTAEQPATYHLLDRERQT